ncbi:MAG: hypothetical protein DRO06_03120 [Thermoproteota archaeon]|nr:MAG: hypothetical protein DRO06_03120 [Candidatus Korarchaeota archaeon]
MPMLFPWTGGLGQLTLPPEGVRDAEVLEEIEVTWGYMGNLGVWTVQLLELPESRFLPYSVLYRRNGRTWKVPPSGPYTTDRVLRAVWVPRPPYCWAEELILVL